MRAPVLKLVTQPPQSTAADSGVETITLTRSQLDYLERAGCAMNPDMPMAFAAGHVIRTLLDKLEASAAGFSTTATDEKTRS